VTYNTTRKHFLAKLLGVGVATGMLAKLFAKSASPAETPARSRASKQKVAFEIRHDTRAVARRDVI
jgi:hypothetical protein